jgi:NADH-quinone oxidoreductase subunit E
MGHFHIFARNAVTKQSDQGKRNREGNKAGLPCILNSARRSTRKLIDILQEVQSREGYLSRENMLEVAGYLGISSATVWGVATFYNQFRFIPPGRKQVRVCMGTACHLSGGQLVLEAMARELKIEVGGTRADGEYSLERVACIGCCALAPVITMEGRVYPGMTPPAVEETLVAVKIEREQDRTDNTGPA